MTGLVQGKDAIMQFDKNGYVPFMCATNISIAITSDAVPIRTVKDGHWKKFTYQNAGYTITLSGLVKFDDINWVGWDFIDNVMNFSHVNFRCSFEDDNGDIKTVQGQAMITSSTLAISPGALVKNDFELTGNGALLFFDGLVPCDAVLASIAITGQTASDGIVHVTYDYSGNPYQVKYRVDGQGDYVYVLIGSTIDIPSLDLGAHTIEIIPVCSNGYEGSGLTQDFSVTRALTCSAVITDISINLTTNSAGPVYTGTPTWYKYRIDGGMWIVNSITITSFSISGLAVGDHTIDMIPICGNNVEGTGDSKTFTVASQPAQATINWDFVNHVSSGTFELYINGVRYILSGPASDSGSLTVPVGTSVRSVLTATDTVNHFPVDLLTQNVTTSETLDHSMGLSPATLVYTFTALGGKTYLITGTLAT